MLDYVIYLFFLVNCWEVVLFIILLLLYGMIVICDCYYYSGIVYLVVKYNFFLLFLWVCLLEVGFLRLDLVLFLDLDE